MIRWTKIVGAVVLGVSFGANIFLLPRLNLVHSQNRALKLEIQNLEQSLEKLETERKRVLHQTEEEKHHLLESTESLRREVETLRSQTAQPEKDSDLKNEVKRLTEQNKLLSKRFRDLYKVTSDKISQINVAKIALEETITDARKKIDEEWAAVDLGSINVGKNAGTQKPQPKNEGKILSINDDHGFVVVDLGRVNQIKDNMLFSVEKDGSAIATLKVLEIRDTMTACNIQDLIQGKKIEVNDLVRIRK